MFSKLFATGSAECGDCQSDGQQARSRGPERCNRRRRYQERMRASHCSTTGRAKDANQADLIVIDPEALSTHDSEANSSVGEIRPKCDQSHSCGRCAAALS